MFDALATHYDPAPAYRAVRWQREIALLKDFTQAYADLFSRPVNGVASDETLLKRAQARLAQITADAEVDRPAFD
jgi:hypothetical protein